MENLNFNIYGLANPKTPTEYIALLDEALRLADEIGCLLDKDTKTMELQAVTAS